MAENERGFLLPEDMKGPSSAEDEKGFLLPEGLKRGQGLGPVDTNKGFLLPDDLKVPQTSGLPDLSLPSQRKPGLGAQVPLGLMEGFTSGVMDLGDFLYDVFPPFELLHYPLQAMEQGRFLSVKEAAQIRDRGVDAYRQEVAEGHQDQPLRALAHGIGEFSTIFIPALGALGAGAKAGQAGAQATTRLGRLVKGKGGQAFIRGEGAAVVAENVVFEPWEARLSNLLQEFPSLANPVAAFLAASPDDSLALATLKQNIEATTLGATIGMALVGGLQLLKAGARMGGKEKEAVEEFAEWTREPGNPMERRMEEIRELASRPSTARDVYHFSTLEPPKSPAFTKYKEETYPDWVDDIGPALDNFLVVEGPDGKIFDFLADATYRIAEEIDARGGERLHIEDVGELIYLEVSALESHVRQFIPRFRFNKEQKSKLASILSYEAGGERRFMGLDEREEAEELLRQRAKANPMEKAKDLNEAAATAKKEAEEAEKSRPGKLTLKRDKDDFDITYELREDGEHIGYIYKRRGERLGYEASRGVIERFGLHDDATFGGSLKEVRARIRQLQGDTKKEPGTTTVQTKDTVPEDLLKFMEETLPGGAKYSAIIEERAALEANLQKRYPTQIKTPKKLAAFLEIYDRQLNPSDSAHQQKRDRKAWSKLKPAQKEAIRGAHRLVEDSMDRLLGVLESKGVSDLDPDDIAHIKGKLLSGILRKPSKLQPASPKEILESVGTMTDNLLKRRGFTPGKFLRYAEALFVDPAGRAKRRVADYGRVGEMAVNAYTLARGASTVADRFFQERSKDIYGWVLNEKEMLALNTQIHLRRMTAIAASNPKAKQRLWDPNTQEWKVVDVAGAMATTRGHFESLDEGVQKHVDVATKAYFGAMRSLLADLHQNGIITGDQFRSMQDINYSPIQLLDMADRAVEINIGGKRVHTTTSGIKHLRGRDITQVAELNSSFLLAQAAARTKSTIANNEAARKLASIADIPQTELARDMPRLISREAPNPGERSGWARMSYFEQGKKVHFWVHKEIAGDGSGLEGWITTPGALSPRVRDFVSTYSGGNILRTMATGINPGFGLVTLLRDPQMIALVNPHYSQFFPLSIGQIYADVIRTMPDAWGRKGLYDEYMEGGGGFSFLSQGAGPDAQVPSLKSHWRRALEVMGYFNTSIEINMRLAAMSRAMRNGASKETAIADARNIVDFGVGGIVSKAADPAMPYLNASIQSLNSIARAQRRDGRPVIVGGQMLMTAAAYNYYLRTHHSETLDQIPEEERAGNVIIPIPTASYKDEMGNERKGYISIPMEPSLVPFNGIAMQLSDFFAGKETPHWQDAAGEFLSTFMSVGRGAVPLSVPPALDASLLKYWANFDPFTGKQVWSGQDVLPIEEYRSRPQTPTKQPFVDIARNVHAVTGIQLSPARLEAATGSIVPRSLQGFMVGKGYEALFGTDEMQALHHANTTHALSSYPMIRRVLKFGHPSANVSPDIRDLAQQNISDVNAVNRWVDYEVSQVQEGSSISDLMGRVKKRVEDAGVPREDVPKYMERAKNGRLFTEAIAPLQKHIGNMASPSVWYHLSSMDPQTQAEYVYSQMWIKLPTEERSRLRRAIARVPGSFGPKFWRAFSNFEKNGIQIPPSR